MDTTDDRRTSYEGHGYALYAECTNIIFGVVN